jgi:hypothetical protein
MHIPIYKQIGRPNGEEDEDLANKIVKARSCWLMMILPASFDELKRTAEKYWFGQGRFRLMFQNKHTNGTL